MLKIDNFNTYFNGSCVVGETIVATFHGNATENENVSVSINTTNVEGFKENLAEVKADFAEFIDEIIGILE